MDKYEKEFLEIIKQSAKNIIVDRVELGNSRLKHLVAMIYLLISERAESFDLLVGGGNSGVATIEIAKMVYLKVGAKIPPIVLLPVVRPSNQKNISIDKDMISEQLKNIQKVEKILFIDDEIMRGQTAKICFEIIRDFLGEEKISPCLSCTIVAENHFFVWRYDLKGVSVRFLPFSTVLQGYNGNFGYLISDDLAAQLEPILGSGPIDRNQALAVLLGDKRKIVNDKISFFDSKINEELGDKIENYVHKKILFIESISKIVDQGIDEYKNGKIKFPFL